VEDRVGAELGHLRGAGQPLEQERVALLGAARPAPAVDLGAAGADHHPGDVLASGQRSRDRSGRTGTDPRPDQPVLHLPHRPAQAEDPDHPALDQAAIATGDGLLRAAEDHG